MLVSLGEIFPIPVRHKRNGRIQHLSSGLAHDTSIHFRSPISFLNQIQGGFRQSLNGTSRYSLNLGFSRKLSAANAEMPFTISGRATLEKISKPGTPSTDLLGMEAVVTGLMRRDPGGSSRWHSTSSNQLILRFERKAGAQNSHAASLQYDHAWIVRELTKIQLQLKAKRTDAKISRSLDVNWQARF